MLALLAAAGHAVELVHEAAALGLALGVDGLVLLGVGELVDEIHDCGWCVVEVGVERLCDVDVDVIVELILRFGYVQEKNSQLLQQR